MRLAYLNASGRMGGAETSLLQLLASVRESQPDWEFTLVLGEDGPLARKAGNLGVSICLLPFPPKLARIGDSGSDKPLPGIARVVKSITGLFETHAYVRRLAALLREINPTLIHTTGFKMHLLGAWARPVSVPVVWHMHDYVSSRPLMRKLLRSQSPKCAGIIANSRSVGEDVRRSCSPACDVTTMYNSIDLARFSPVGRTMDLDAAAGLPPAKVPIVRLGLIATFANWKGHHLFLKALSLVPANMAFRAYVVGGAIYQTDGSQVSLNELREEARSLGLGERVGFTGFVDEPELAVRALDIVVHASTQPEPFGMVIVEALACGKAVVASDVSGASEIVSPGRDLLTFRCGDADELANRLSDLLTSSESRLRMGEAGRRSVEQLLRGSRLAAELIAVYEKISPSPQRREVALSAAP